FYRNNDTFVVVFYFILQREVPCLIIKTRVIRMNFGRMLTAMVTPCNEEGSVDEQQTRLLVNHLVNNGSEGLILTGTTGESPTLSKIEKIALYKNVLKFANRKISVIAGTGTNNT